MKNYFALVKCLSFSKHLNTSLVGFVGVVGKLRSYVLNGFAPLTIGLTYHVFMLFLVFVVCSYLMKTVSLMAVECTVLQ